MARDASVLGTNPAAPASSAASARSRCVVPLMMATGAPPAAALARASPSNPFIPGML
ncbi:MAG: hypothetical protein Q27BPR15_02320 [Rhodobacter sp. CACIA14H1]|nr:MAG: hypothetical protein Q27BPR15_02320 [Rhodobacter sp. CACIA14H1]